MARQRQRRPRRASGPGRTPRHDIIVIGASAGGIEAMRTLAQGLSGGLAASLFVVVHLGAASPRILPRILDDAGPLAALPARDRVAPERGRIYVAPPDHHLLLERGRMRVIHGPKENRHRPSIDALFRSAAWSYGPRVIGVLLTGMLDDGTAGLWAIKSCGGIAVIQSPDDAKFPDMPRNARTWVDIDHELPLDRIPSLLARLARRPATGRHRVPARTRLETRAARLQGTIEDMDKLGQPSIFSCPACHGVLWEIKEGGLLRYRCHTGHAFGSASLADAQADNTDTALNTALRSMHERSASLRRMAETYGRQHPELGARYRGKADELEQSASTLRKMLARA
jgi:two-component system chemotaxis response regulator CheB